MLSLYIYVSRLVHTEPLVNDVDKLKYIDESTDDEYVMAILNKIPISRLSHVVEEPLLTSTSSQLT